MDAYFIIGSGFGALYDYALAHTLFCLVPAFFIAGAMAALIPKDELLPYLGKNSPKIVAYPLAVASGLLLAVCSCTVLPLFAGIRKGGAGIGPAIAFLYTAPATNIIAILYTASLIGWDTAIARITFSVLFAVVIGLVISSFSLSEEGSAPSDAFRKKAGAGRGNARLLYLFGALIAVLLVGTRISEELLKYGLTLALIAVIALISKKFFSRDELLAWVGETWGFAKTIFPLLLAGVFLSGIIGALMPKEFVAAYVGGNGITDMAIPVIFGIFVYFPTLVEVPMAKTFLALGMSKGAVLAYLLADPVVSLPSILVVRRIMGTKRTLVYVGLIFVLSIAAGLLFGFLFATG